MSTHERLMTLYLPRRLRARLRSAATALLWFMLAGLALGSLLLLDKL